MAFFIDAVFYSHLTLKFITPKCKLGYRMMVLKEVAGWNVSVYVYVTSQR